MMNPSELISQSVYAPGWPDRRFVNQDRCLYCGGGTLAACIDQVRDWYFRAVPGSFGWLQCQDCLSLVLEKRPDDSFIHEAYRNYYTHQVSKEQNAAAPRFLHRLWRMVADGYARSRHGTSSALVDRTLAMLVDWLPARKLEIDTFYRFLQPRSLKVLDFGCGNGDFLLRAKALGHRVFGVDFDEAAIQTAKEAGIPAARINEIDADAFDSAFDLITANHVLEHVADPQMKLLDFYRWLKPGGMLFLELPDAQARGLAKHGNFWRGLEAPRHFSLPSRKGIAIALTRAGFLDVAFVDRKNPQKQMDVIALEARRKYPDSLFVQPRIGVFESFEFITLTARKGNRS